MLDNEAKNIEDTLAIDAYRIEVERVKFLLKSYLRTRLAKIEHQLFYLIKERESVKNILSPEEWKYVFTLCSLRGNYYNENFFKMIPKIFRLFEEKKPIPTDMAKPPTDSYVFIRIVQSAGVCQFAGEYVF